MLHPGWERSSVPAFGDLAAFTRSAAASGLPDGSILCLNNVVEQRRFPDWPAECRLGHPWRPGTVWIEWALCDCPPAAAARGGHLEVRCGHQGCQERWQRPLCRPDRTPLGHHRPSH